MTVHTQNGKVLTQNGYILCRCCDLALSLGNVADCDCFYQRTSENPNGVPRPCFTEENPAPETVILNGVPTENYFYPFGYFGGEIALQIPWDFTTSPQPGWKTFVTEPNNVRLFGNVVGDVVIISRRVVGSSRYEGSPPQAQNFEVIPQEGLFPCGACAKNGGAHAFDYTWVMYPFTSYLIMIQTYLSDYGGNICSPWLRARIQRLGAAAP